MRSGSAAASTPFGQNLAVAPAGDFSARRVSTGALTLDGEASPEHWLQRLWVEGVTTNWLSFIGKQRQRVIEAVGANLNASLRAFAALGALGRGDHDLANEFLAERPDPAQVSLAARLVDATARLYRACGDAEHDPAGVPRAMHELSEVEQTLLQDRGSVNSLEGATALGYAGLSLADALLRVGDVGAARHQLERVVGGGNTELAPPAVLRATARCILGGIELAVGRTDLAVLHLQMAVQEAIGHPPEEQAARLLLICLMLSENHCYGEALLRDLAAHQPPASDSGHGTIAHLHHMLQFLSRPAPYSLPDRLKLREVLRFLQERHESAGWFLLLTGLSASCLQSAGDPCEAYNVLVHAAAALRCRRVEGAADLCDRQIDSLRLHLGEERFEAVVNEARERRQSFLKYLHQGR